MDGKIAIVTGSNKGLGFGIVKLLCKRGIEIVYLTSRDVVRGLNAVKILNSYKLKPNFYQLDILDRNSIKNLAEHVKNEHGHLDILINNAGVLGDFTQLTYEDAKKVIDTNYKSNFVIQEYLFPLLRDNARVINISSDGGLIGNLRNQEWIQRLTNNNVTLEDVNNFVEWFLDSVRNNTLNPSDFVAPQLLPYRVSKIALNALTKIQQKQVGRGISINSIHPGLVQTDMTYNTGVYTVDEASEGPVYLALDINQSIKGRFLWHDRTEKDWTDINIKIEGTIKALETGSANLA